jgi:hypothetical protein
MAAKPKVKPVVEGNIVDAMTGTFADYFVGGDSWRNWHAILKGAYGLPLTEEERTFFHEVAEREPPGKRVRELWVIGGRRGGKDSIASAIIAHSAALFNGRRRQIAGMTLPPMRRGERATILCLGNDRDQARIVLGYVREYFTLPKLAKMITRETRDGFELANGLDILVATNDFRSIRGRAVLLGILDECAFYRDERSASPDVELYNALTPGMLTLRDQAMLIGISTPHKKAGLLWTKYQDSYGRDDPNVLFERHGMRLLQSPHPRSELYLNLLPALNAGKIKLLDLPRLRSQLLSLERRTIRGTGRDVVDHQQPVRTT